MKPNDQTPGISAGARARARCALLTPYGAGAVAAIRVCGVSAWDVVSSCLRGRDGARPKHIDDGKLWFGQFCDDSDALDDVIVAFWPGGASGPVVDITCHGGIRVVERILLALARRGAAVVQAGELDDAAAFGAGAIERDVQMRLPQCSTRRGARYVLRQQDLLAAELKRIADLVDDGCEDQARAAIRDLVDRGEIARAFLEPATVALIGPVNAGKSSLANRLAGREQSIVSDRPGTTRDWVTIDVGVNGVPMTLIDTPGHATDPDALEREAIDRAKRLTQTARIRILVLDATRLHAIDPEPWLDQPDQPVAVTVINKLDRAEPDAAAVDRLAGRTRVLCASALTGTGVSQVGDALVSAMGLSDGFDALPSAFGPVVRSRLALVLNLAPPLGLEVGREIRGLAACSGV